MPDLNLDFGRTADFKYAGKFTAASEIFTHLSPHDPVATSYLKKCGFFQDEPPLEWQGVWKVTEKG